MKVGEVIKAHYLTLSILVVYSFLRLYQLTLLPIFNDESIYLDWGWRETQTTGHLFYSLYDGKQPLLLWIFGVSQQIFADQLFAGRIISVITGLLTLYGLFRLGSYLFTKKIGYMSALLYSVIPLFSFYDRQALMESAVACIGVWSCIYLLRVLTDQSYGVSASLGGVLGIGFFIKSSVLLFILSAVVLSIVQIFIAPKDKRSNYLRCLFITTSVFFATIFLLLIQPEFWSTVSSNARYSLTLTEIVSFPILHWIKNIWSMTEISFFYLTPPVFLTMVVGLFILLKNKNKQILAFLCFFLLTLVFEVLTARSLTTRYVMSFLPFITLLVAVTLYTFITKQRVVGMIISFIVYFFPLFVTCMLVSNPIQYFSAYSHITNYSDESFYVSGSTSGYGLNRVINYLTQRGGSSYLVTLAQNTGNPESAVITYFHKNNAVPVTYLDTRLQGNAVIGYDCLRYDGKFFFISREDQLAGMDKFLQKVTSIKNPYGNNTTGIYILKKNCKGKTFTLSLTD